MLHAYFAAAVAVYWFEFENISDWLLKLTTDDVMETLLSSALKNSRMIYNEMQPLTFFSRGLGSTLDSGAQTRFFMYFELLTFMLLKNITQPSHPVNFNITSFIVIFGGGNLDDSNCKYLSTNKT